VELFLNQVDAIHVCIADGVLAVLPNKHLYKTNPLIFYMRSKVLVLDSSNALKRLAFEHDLDDLYNSGYDLEESYIVSEEKIVFLLLSCRSER